MNLNDNVDKMGTDRNLYAIVNRLMLGFPVAATVMPGHAGMDVLRCMAVADTGCCPRRCSIASVAAAGAVEQVLAQGIG